MTSLQTGDLQTGFSPGHGWGLGFAVVREPQGPTQMVSGGRSAMARVRTQSWADLRAR